MQKTVLAIAAHPDDIEFVMSGTLMRLKAAGWRLHYHNIANGCGGSLTLPADEIAAVRLGEAQAAAAALGATFHPPFCDDLAVFYTPDLMRKLAAVVRQTKPSIILTHAPIDYMEDHQNAARLAVFGAFSRGVPNYETEPPRDAFSDPVAVYHAQPHGNRTPMREIVKPTLTVDVTDLLKQKRDLLALHASQASWLGDTQAMSYLQTMEDLGREVGLMSGRFEIAEGWRQHLHLGLAPEDFDPLSNALAPHAHFLTPAS
ncbi:MAG: PIG-L family deacetylase [Aureliella sp.]